jgi:hypothetical protein
MNKTDTGLVIIDSTFAIELRLGTQWYGWLFNKHPDGKYVSIKKLNDGEILNIKSSLTKQKCTWSNSEGVDGEDTDTHWSTSCGEEFIITDGTPEDNNMGYCCYCGKPIDQLIEE